MYDKLNKYLSNKGLKVQADKTVTTAATKQSDGKALKATKVKSIAEVNAKLDALIALLFPEPAAVNTVTVPTEAVNAGVKTDGV